MIKLTAQGKFIDTKEMEHLLTQGEKCADIIHLVLDAKNNDVDIKDCVFVLRTVASEGSMTETILPKTIMNEQILLMWKVPYTATAVPGMLRLELIGTKSEETIIKFKMPPIYVKDAVMGSNVPVPDVVDEKLLQMSEMIENALNIENKLSGESGIFKEIIDARKGTLDTYSYDSLSQRLEREFNLCVQRSVLEIALRAAIEEANDVGVGRIWKDESGKSQGEVFNDYENNVASDEFSHAEGRETAASGRNSHSEGFSAKARGMASHAEGNSTLAWASHSHAEGQGTIVRGINSHAEGFHTIADSDNQHVGGKYNIADLNNSYAYIIGNGKNVDKRSNALTLDWNGDLWLSGDVTATDADGQEISMSVLNSELKQTETIVQNVVAIQNNLIQGNNNEHSILNDSLGMQKKNWLKNTHSIGSTTINGINFTTNADGSVTANGTSTADASYNIVVVLPPNTSFILSGCPSAGSASTYNIFAIETDSFTKAYRDIGNGAEFNTGSYTEWSFRIRVVSGQTVNDLTFYPMVRSAAVSDSEYAPYTDDLQTQINELRTQVAALTGAAIVSELQVGEAQ